MLDLRRLTEVHACHFAPFPSKILDPGFLRVAVIGVLFLTAGMSARFHLHMILWAYQLLIVNISLVGLPPIPQLVCSTGNCSVFPAARSVS